MKPRYNQKVQAQASDREHEQLCQRCETIIEAKALTRRDILGTFDTGEVVYPDPRTWWFPQLRKFLATWAENNSPKWNEPGVTLDLG